MGFNKSEFLSALEPFCALSAEETAALAQGCQLRDCAPKEVVFAEGEQGELAYVVVDGRIALIKTSPSGKELIVELVLPGEVFGVVVLLQNAPYPLTARAQVRSRVLQIPKRAFAPRAASHPELIQRMMEIVSARLRQSHDLSRALAHDRVERRIAAALIFLDRRINQAAGGETLLVLARHEIADIVGVSPETFTRVTKKFEEDGILNLADTKTIRILDIARLSCIAESA